MRRWHARQEDRGDKVDLLLVWPDVFAAEIRTVCEQFSVTIELLELKLTKLEEDFLDALDRQKWQLSKAIHHDPGLEPVAELFKAKHEKIKGIVKGVRLALQFPVIPRDRHPVFGGPAKVKDDPALLKLVKQFEPSIQCSVDIPFSSQVL